MHTTIKSFLFIIRCTPFSALAKDALDAVLVAAAFHQTISVLFMSDGVYQLLKNQQPKLLHGRNLSASWQALPLYDIDRIYLCESSISQRSLQLDQLVMSAEIISTAEIQNLMRIQQAIFTY